MGESFGALSTDFYIDHQLQVKMDLPSNRETLLGVFDRMRREYSTMDRFRRGKAELVLESDPAGGSQQMLGLRRTSVRSGWMNPATPAKAYKMHKTVLELTPFFLSISPLDVDFVELMYGFDMQASGNHDAIVFDALMSGSPLAGMLDVRGAVPLDCQPLLTMALNEAGDLQAQVEVKTRPGSRAGKPADGGPPEPISVILALRKYGEVKDIKELPEILAALAQRGEDLLAHRLVPNLLVPLRDAIASGNSDG